MDVNSLDLSLTYCDTCQIFNTAVYETLHHPRSADPTRLLPRLATSWEANADNTVFTFNLDPAAKFDDGSPVEANDVKFSWERLENMKAPASYLMAGLKTIDDTRRRHRRRHVLGAELGVPRRSSPPATSASSTARSPGAGRSRPADAAATDKAGDVVPVATRRAAGRTSSSRTPRATSWCSAATTNYWGPNKPVFPKVTLPR